MNFLLVLLLLLLICVINILICTQKNNKIYCYIYEHKEWVLWEEVCKKLQFAKFAGHHTYEDAPECNNFRFYIHDIKGGVEVTYFENIETVGVFDLQNNCLLSDFDRYHSKKAIEIIKKMI